MAAKRITVRTVAEFAKLVAAYLKKTKMSGTRLSALAVGDIRFVNHVLAGNASRVSLNNVDAVLSYIEKNPKGEA